jgi:NTP pyrophosphatase (non-canonical NTP hydrolase)
MNINELTQRALQIKKLYAQFDEKKSHKVWTREEVYQGLVSDVGDLGRLVLATEGFADASDVHEKLGHELAEILWATLLLSNEYNIDITKAFSDEMDRLESHLSE